MPEGTSHHESHLIRLKTGPARVLTSAATIANFQGRNKPQIIPVGMHFRKRHLFRTDIWVEFCDPINYELSQELLDLGSKYDEEKWIEPPAEDVYHVRDLLKLNLEKVTPGAINWDTYRGWRLLAHLKARNENKSNLTWREEVELTRDWRDLSDQTIGTHEEQKELGPRGSNTTELFSQAESAAKILDDLKSIPGVLLGVLLFPFLSISSGLILAVCNYLGNVTDEGEDARTSIHFAGFILTPFIFWPLMAAFSVFLLAFFLDIRPAIMGWEQITLFQSVPFYLAIWTFMFPLFWLINRISLTYCLDSFNDILWEIRINSLQKSKLINELEKSLDSLNLKIKDY